MGAQLLKSKVKAANDKRQVRIPSETDGKPEVKTVLDYDTEAVDTLSVQSFIVRAPIQPPPASSRCAAPAALGAFAASRTRPGAKRARSAARAECRRRISCADEALRARLCAA